MLLLFVYQKCKLLSKLFHFSEILVSTCLSTESCEQSNSDLIFGRNPAMSAIYLTSERVANPVFWDGRHYNPVGSDIRLLCCSAVAEMTAPVPGSWRFQLSDRLWWRNTMKDCGKVGVEDWGKSRDCSWGESNWKWKQKSYVDIPKKLPKYILSLAVLSYFFLPCLLALWAA